MNHYYFLKFVMCDNFLYCMICFFFFCLWSLPLFIFIFVFVFVFVFVLYSPYFRHWPNPTTDAINLFSNILSNLYKLYSLSLSIYLFYNTRERQAQAKNQGGPKLKTKGTQAFFWKFCMLGNFFFVPRGGPGPLCLLRGSVPDLTPFYQLCFIGKNKTPQTYLPPISTSHPSKTKKRTK